jgi:hypothetical protein
MLLEDSSKGNYQNAIKIELRAPHNQKCPIYIPESGKRVSENGKFST